MPSGPITDLRDATRKVGDGDLTVRVPVVSTDETGELAASFNAMVAGLGKRRQLHEAFGAFINQALTERVLAEGTDLRGEEIEVSILFVDVRGFTASPRPPPRTRSSQRWTALRGGGAGDPPARRACRRVPIGDGLLAVFGVPERDSEHADARGRGGARRSPSSPARGWAEQASGSGWA